LLTCLDLTFKADSFSSGIFLCALSSSPFEICTSFVFVE